MAEAKSFDLRRHLPSAAFVLIALLVIAGFSSAFLFAGVYNVGADSPHYKVVHMALEKFRERAVAHHARNLAVPADLADPERISSGAGLYQEMCTACHLGPGLEKSELSQGLYPAAPELAKVSDLSPAQQFWIIKHGIKLSAMPAWGKTHSDALIWDMVAFVETLPKLTPGQYKAAIASAPADHGEMMEGMKDMHGDAEPPADADADHPAGHSHTGHTH